jgi:hypothetical protein
VIPPYHDTPEGIENVVIFFTDGVPSGPDGDTTITDPVVLRQFINGLIGDTGKEISIFSLSVGTDADFQFLTLLSTDNNGIAVQAPVTEVEAAITELYDYIDAPAMLDPEMTTIPANVLTEVYPEPLPNLYIGRQCIITGRYSNGGGSALTVNFDGAYLGTPLHNEYSTVLSDSISTRFRIINKIWAKQKIEHLLVEYYSADPGSAEAYGIKQQVIDVSLAYGVLSPFTSFTGSTGKDDEVQPGEPVNRPYKLIGNFPNPFNPSTTIRFEVAKPLHRLVFVRIYNLRGQLVCTLGVKIGEAGQYQALWSGVDQRKRPVATGTYFYVIDFGDAQLSGKMLLLK